MLELSAGAYADLVTSPFADEHVGVGDGGAAWIVSGDVEIDLPSPGSLPVPVIGRGDALGGSGPPAADAVFGESELDDVLARIGHAPRSAAALAVLMRDQPSRRVDAGLAAESAVYSVLQSGPEFATWRAARSRRPQKPERATVLVERHDNTL